MGSKESGGRFADKSGVPLILAKASEGRTGVFAGASLEGGTGVLTGAGEPALVFKVSQQRLLHRSGDRCHPSRTGEDAGATLLKSIGTPNSHLGLISTNLPMYVSRRDRETYSRTGRVSNSDRR